MNHQNKTSKNLFLSGSKIIRASSFVFIAAALVVSGFFAPQQAFAAATVTPASGGTNISIDTTSAGGSDTFTELSGPGITEQVAGDISEGIHTITLPTGWVFDTASPITVSKIGNIGLASTNITPGATSFEFTVTSASTNTSILIFNGIKVKPTGTTPSTGSMTYSGTGIVGVVEGVTNFGTLSTVPGTVTKLAFTTQPGNAEYGSLLSPQPVVKTQDQFGNNSIKDLASSLEVGLTLTGGTGALVGDATLDIGTGVGNGTVTFTDLTVDEFGAGKQLTAAAAGLTSAVSGNFEITKKPLTATITADDKVYDGSNSATITGVDLVGVVGGDAVVADFSAATATFEDENAGTEKAVNATGITLTGDDADNYDFGGTATGVADITPLEITITPIAGQTKIYGQADPVFAYTADPLIGTDAFTGVLSRVAGEDVNTYTYTPGSLSAGSNYELTLVPGTFGITQRTLNVTATGINKVYDATTDATVTLNDDRVGGDELTLGYTAIFTDSKNVGTNKPVSVTDITITGGADIGNYVLGNTTAATTANVTEKQLTVSFTTDANKTYNGNITAAITGRSLEGVIVPEVVDVTGGSASFADKHIGTDKTVTATGFTLTGADKDNYAIGTINTTTGNVNPRPITVTAVTDTKIYNGTANSDETPVVTSTFSPPVALVDTASFIQTYDNKNVGEDKMLTPSGVVIDGNPVLEGSNYTVTFAPVETGEITEKSINVTAQTDTKVYDGTTDSSVAPVVDALETGDTVGTAPIQTYDNKNVGTVKTLTPSGLVINDGNGGNNYLPVYVNDTTGEIEAKNLTVTGATTNPKTYDGDEIAEVDFSSAGLVGVVGEENVSLDSIGYSATYDNKNVATGKTVTVSGLVLAGDDASNYSLTQPVLNDGVITPATLTVTATGINKVYDGSTDAEAILSGDTIGDDEVTFGYVANFTDKNVGEDKTINVLSISINGGEDAGNYILGNTTAETTADITPASLTATITADDKVYDGNTSAIITGRTLIGVIFGDDVTANADGTATFDTKDVGTDKVVSAIGITITGSDAGNYTYDGTAAGTADITPLEITVTPNADQSKTYGDADPSFVYTFDPALIGDEEFVGGLSREEGENVGTYDYTLGDLSAGSNYSLTLVPGTFEITQRQITVTAVTDTKVYDGTTNSAATPEITDGSLAFSDEADFTQTYDNKNVGTGKILTPDGIVNDGNEGANYNIAFVTDETGAITEKELTVSGLSAADKTYDGTTAADVSGTPALVGVEDADDVSLAGTAIGEFNTANAGVNTVPVSGLSLTGADAFNYMLTQPVLEAEILQLELTGSFTTENKVYDGNTTAAVLTQSLDGALPADEGNVILTGGAADFADPNVANGITVTASGMTLSGSAAGNYALASVDTATADITQLEIVVTPDAGQSKVYGQLDPAFTYTNTPALIGEDAFSGALSRVEGEDAGTYEYELGSLTVGGNYSLVLETETFEIVKATPVITWANPADIVYGTALSGTELNATADVDGEFVYTPVSGTVLNAGEGQELSVTFTPTDTVNYESVTQEALITVTPAPLTVTADNKTKGYGTSDPALTYEFSGLVNDDTDAVFNGSLEREVGEEVGEYEILQGTLLAGSNYAIAYESGTFTIEDTVAPTLLSHTPSVNAVNVAVGSNITITFSEPVNVAEGTITLNPGISFTMSGDGTNVITLTPTSAWDDNTVYTVTVTTGVEDVNGLPLASSYSWSFTTATSYNINLNAGAGGWNLISLPVVPTNKNISAVLSGVESSVEAVWTYDPLNPNAVDGWLVYVPGNPEGTNNLTLMTAGFGYWVSVTGNATISGSGSLFPVGPTTPPQRELVAGWNLIGYYQLPGEELCQPSNAFVSLGGWNSLFGFNNLNASPVFPVIDVLPGDAFWVSLPSAGVQYTLGNSCEL